MSEAANASSGAPDSSSGDSTSKQLPETRGDGNYPKDFVDKLKKEKENLSKGKSALEEQVNALLKEKQSREEAELQAQNKFEQLYQAQKVRAETFEKELASTREMITEGKKNTAIRSELFKLGLDEAHVETAFKLLDKNAVQVDPSTGVVFGADEAAKAFHQSYGSLGLFKKQASGVNHSAPGGNNPSAPEVSKLSQAEKLKMLVALKK